MTQTDRVRSVKQARAKHPFPLQLFVIFASELILSPTQLRRERWREREELDRSEASDAAGHWHRLSRASTPLGGMAAAGAPPSAAARRARLRGRRGSRERVEAGSYATASPSWTARTGWTSRAGREEGSVSRNTGSFLARSAPYGRGLFQRCTSRRRNQEVLALFA